MHVGSTDENGVEVLPRTLIDNAIDAFLAGMGGEIGVNLHADHSVEVRSNTVILPDLEAYALPDRLRQTFLVTHDRMDPPYNERPYPGDLCWPSFADVGEDYRVSDAFRSDWEWCRLNALCRRVSAEVHDGRQGWRQEFADQQPVGGPQPLGSGAPVATCVTVWPDEALFGAARPRWSRLYAYLEQSSYLVPGLRLHLVDERVTPTRSHSFPVRSGVGPYLAAVWGTEDVLCGPLVIEETVGRTRVQLVLAVARAAGEIVSFVNNYQTRHGGSHVAGFLGALRHVLRRVSEEEIGPRAMRHLVARVSAIVSVWTPTPLFRGGVRSVLYSPEVGRDVRTVSKAALFRYVATHPDDVRRIQAL
jgi:DNA gyrase subunit B